ncbi:MAG: yidC [Gammaproteobacteria bacterium]|jgi:YidC/Oxa1 family membrane protein insertase|nr:yidC [Gammaproteobacteria bacterium]
MESTRIFLFIALVTVSYFLWNAWEAEHQISQPLTSVLTTNPIPSEIKSHIASSAKEPATKAMARFINVQTDLLDVVINTQGGDIVKTSLRKYPKALKSSEPFDLLNSDPNSIYIAQSGLVSQAGPDKQQAAAIYQADQANYQLNDDQKELTVNLKWRNNEGLEVVKTYTFKRDSYVIDVAYQVNNNSNQAWTGQFYTQLKRLNLPEHKQMFQFSTFTGASISSPEKLYEKITYKKLSEKDLNRQIKGGWLAFQQHYFLSAWVPNSEQVYTYYSHANGDIYTLGAISSVLSAEPHEKLQTAAKIYIGPEVADYLKTVAPGLDLTIDYGWLWIISSFLFWLMKHIYNVVGNWGWAIVIVTLLIKLVFYKLSATSYRSMARMRELQPKIETLKEMYGDDRQKMSQEMMKLYREQKVNPFGGCLPILVQIPFFIALYYVLIESVELRQAPFILWIHDLASADPYYVLPILMGASMLLQQRLSPTPPDPIQAKVMMALPIVFTFLFLNFPAGLVLYWVVNNSLSILQQWYITRRLKLAPPIVHKSTKSKTKRK